MHCFYHQDSEAIGLCKHCSRALCAECVVATADGLSCKGSHEEIVKGLNLLIERNVRMAKAGVKSSWVATSPMILIGLAIMLFDIYSHQSLTFSSGTVLGSVFMLCGIGILFYNLKFFSKKPNTPK